VINKSLPSTTATAFFGSDSLPTQYHVTTMTNEIYLFHRGDPDCREHPDDPQKTAGLLHR